MKNIKLEGTNRSPEVDLDFSSNRFFFGGFSFPENVKEFYNPILAPLEQHLESLTGTDVTFIFSFSYFHSSTAQVVYNLFDALEKCASNGNTVTVTWRYEADDEDMEEAGEDFAEELEHVQFSLEEIDPD